jgi:hypothetical protein
MITPSLLTVEEELTYRFSDCGMIRILFTDIVFFFSISYFNAGRRFATGLCFHLQARGSYTLVDSLEVSHNGQSQKKDYHRQSPAELNKTTILDPVYIRRLEASDLE